MAKIKVHELAKELELQSKDILSFLQEKGIEAKAAQSSLEEDAAALVRNSLLRKRLRHPQGKQRLRKRKFPRRPNLLRRRKRRKRLFSLATLRIPRCPDSVRAVRVDRVDRDREMQADSVRIRAADTRTMVTRIIPTATVFRHRLPYVPSSR